VPAYTDIREKEKPVSNTGSAASRSQPEDTAKASGKTPRTPMSSALRAVAARKLATIHGTTLDRVNYALGIAARGDFVSAETLCDVLMEHADRVGEDVRVVRDCLEFGIPLERLRYLMSDMKMREADELVTELLMNKGHNPEQRKYLTSIKLATARHLVNQDPRLVNNDILEIVKQILIEYHAETGHFPLSFRELNEVLPPDAPPLTEYDVIEYSGSNQHFTVQLRSRENPNEVLSLHQSAFVE